MSDAARRSLLVSAALILDAAGRELLVARRAPGDPLAGLWEFPGGKVEPHEDPRAALRREIREELDCDVKVGRIAECLFAEYPDKTAVILCFVCALAPGAAPRAVVPDEIRWVPIARLDELPFVPGDTRYVRDLAAAARAGRCVL